jgi:D-alanine transfer protein
MSQSTVFPLIFSRLMKPGVTFSRPHLVAASLALGFAAVAMVAGLLFCERLETRYIHALAPEFTDAKLQGVTLQEHAFAQDNLLVLYGSSELVKEMPNNASEFFRDYPTGFRVFPVGKPGTTALAVLQKIAAVGDDLKGRKVAYSISPGVFFSEVFDPQYYEGNFSNLQALELAFSDELSRNLKRDVARRMLDFPKTLQGKWLLYFALRRLAGDTPLDRALYAAVWPLGCLHKAISRGQDHVEAVLHIVENNEKFDAVGVRHDRVLNWNHLLARAAQFANRAAVQAKRKEVSQRRAAKSSREKMIMQAVVNAREWTDLELLMRTFKELGAEPLLLSMPVEDIRLEVYGASPAVRTAYLSRLRALASSYDLPLLDFREHEKDPAFLIDFLDHLSGKGWLYYDKALDDFFHDRLLTLGLPSPALPPMPYGA